MHGPTSLVPRLGPGSEARDPLTYYYLDCICVPPKQRGIATAIWRAGNTNSEATRNLIGHLCPLSAAAVRSVQWQLQSIPWHADAKATCENEVSDSEGYPEGGTGCHFCDEARDLPGLSYDCGNGLAAHVIPFAKRIIMVTAQLQTIFHGDNHLLIEC